jgi:hypothetical protein
VDPTPDQDEQALLDELRSSQERAQRLSRELTALDLEREELHVEGEQYALLQQACGALEKLEEQGAADLFWGQGGESARGEERLRGVRGRIDDFQQRLTSLDQARQKLSGELGEAQGQRVFIEEDLLDAREAAERKKLEWVVEREVSQPPSRPERMPWARGTEDDARFRKSLAATMLASLLLSVLLSVVELPVADRWEVIEEPDRLTQLIREERVAPPPPPVQEEVAQREVEPEVLQEAPKVAEQPAPEPTTTEPSAPSPRPQGILAFRDKFSGLAKDDKDAALGAQARIDNSGEDASGRATRSLVTTSTPGASGGVDVSSLSRNVGGRGQGLEGVQVARATSAIGGVGNGSGRPLSGGPGMSRTDEEIQIVFDRHKASLYRLYNKALRLDPTLRGQIVLRIRIEADGSVSLCELKSTDMDAPKLAQQVVSRVKTFDFGAKEGIPAITILYPIDFLPAT